MEISLLSVNDELTPVNVEQIEVHTTKLVNENDENASGGLICRNLRTASIGVRRT